jgi:hypothetical protein
LEVGRSIGERSYYPRRNRNKEQVYTLQLRSWHDALLAQSRWFSSTAFFYTRHLCRSHVSSRRSTTRSYPWSLREYCVTCVRRKPHIWKGAVVCGNASMFIRFGNFELFSSQNDLQH